MLVPAWARRSSDQRDGIWFVPHVLLHEVFRLVGLRILQDVVQILAAAGQDFIDLVDSVRIIPRTLVRQSLRKIFRLVFRKILLKDFRQIVRKAVRVQIVVELFTQEIVPVPRVRALESDSFSSGATAKPPTPRTLHRL